jgi:hypothetical protein
MEVSGELNIPAASPQKKEAPHRRESNPESSAVQPLAVATPTELPTETVRLPNITVIIF